MLERLRARLARWIAPRAPLATRMYASARASRLAGAEGSDSSADMELVTSLRSLRSRSRALVRDASYAKRAKVIVQNNVIGPGVGMQANVKSTRGELNRAVNDAIEEEFCEWAQARSCHTGGELHLHDLERAAIGQVFDAGEVLIRKHFTKFGNSRVPLALELVEAERIADEVQPSPRFAGNMVRMGVEVDRFYRPVGYWIRERHRGEFRLGVTRSDEYEFVPAEQIWHLRIIDRWPQTRGEPWLHTVIRKLQDIDGYSEAEIVAARGAANYMASVESPDPHTPLAGAQAAAGEAHEVEIAPGIVVRLAPGEKLNFHTPTRPNTAMDPFMRLMLREVAAGVGASYESLSRDYSQSNYSSSRLALLDDRDLWRVIQGWYIRGFRHSLHQIWLQQAVLARAVSAVPLEAYMTDARRYNACRFKPRGWSWIDPAKEVAAFKEAVRCGFTTVGDVIAQTGDGDDLEDKLEKRERELEMMHEAGLVFDTDPEREASGATLEPAKDDPPEDAPPPEDKGEEKTQRPATERVVSFRR